MHYKGLGLRVASRVYDSKTQAGFSAEGQSQLEAIKNTGCAIFPADSHAHAQTMMRCRLRHTATTLIALLKQGSQHLMHVHGAPLPLRI